MLAGARSFAAQVFGDPSDVEEATRLVPDSVFGWELAVVGLLLLAWALSVTGSLVAFAWFTVARDGERLRIRRGCCRTEAAVPVRRVHVRVVEGLMRRPFGLRAADRGRRLRRRGGGGTDAVPAAPAERRRAVPRRAAAGARRRPGWAPCWPRGRRAAPLLPRSLVGAALGAAACVVFPSVSPWPLLPCRCWRSTAGSTTARAAGACARATSP